MAKIGTSEWWTETADKVINTGLSVIQTKLQGVDQTSGSSPAYRSTESGMTKYLPYVIGAAAIGGIFLIMSKR
jgi:hypothetical protein